MTEKYFQYIYLALFAVLLIGCSATQQNSDDEKQVYIFDEVPEEKTIEAPSSGEYPGTSETYYVVQIGAFTTEEKAQSFEELSRSKTNYKYSVIYSENLKLYLVQVIPFFKSRSEAEAVRNNLWKISDFVDAWIVTVNK